MLKTQNMELEKQNIEKSHKISNLTNKIIELTLQEPIEEISEIKEKGEEDKIKLIHPRMTSKLILQIKI
jgi:hypothetical protein